MSFQLLAEPTHVAVFTGPTGEPSEVITADVVGYEQLDHPMYLPRPFEGWRKVGDHVEFGPHGIVAEVMREADELGAYWIKSKHAHGCEHAAENDHHPEAWFAIHSLVEGPGNGAFTEYEPLVVLKDELGIHGIGGLWTAISHYESHYTYENAGVVGMYLGIYTPDMVQKAVSAFRKKMPTSSQREAKSAHISGAV
jgi:hypothetical protein